MTVHRDETAEPGHSTDGSPCPCMPRQVGGVMVHNSFDGREVGAVIMRLIETAAEIAEANHQWTAAQREAIEHAEAIVALHWPEDL